MPPYNHIYRVILPYIVYFINQSTIFDYIVFLEPILKKCECRSFLSGGVDSSYLLASSGVSEAIGIGFSESICSETPFASAAAEKIGAHFHEVRISAEEYFDVIPRFLRNLELPLADPSAPAFALGCEQAKKKAGPCLSGEGADEFFAGYYVYRRADELGRENSLYCGWKGIFFLVSVDLPGRTGLIFFFPLPTGVCSNSVPPFLPHSNKKTELQNIFCEKPQKHEFHMKSHSAGK